jgi:hypothetical protein
MKKLVISFALLFVSLSVFSQSSNYQTYTLFVFSFTRFVQWPPEESTGDFEILVLGDSPIVAELKTMAEKKKSRWGTTINVTKIASLADYKKCHILYIVDSNKIPEVNAKVGDASVLLVTDQATGANKGYINFFTREGRLAFEMNKDQMTKHKLRAANELTRLAVIN